MTEQELKKHVYNRLDKHYKYIQSLGYEILFCAAQGSMNYNLFIYDENYKSDVDTKIVILPKLDDLIKGNKMVSTKYDFEGEQIDVKDIRVMMDMWKKQNQSYLEILFTDFCIVNPKYMDFFKTIIPMKNDIANMHKSLLAKCIVGMATEKYHALEHEYPATKDKIAKFGYDPKQLASLLRLEDLMRGLFIDKKDFKEAMQYKDKSLREGMIQTKIGALSLNKARESAKNSLDNLDIIRNDVLNNEDNDFIAETWDKLKNNVYHTINQSIRNEIKYEKQNIE